MKAAAAIFLNEIKIEFRSLQGLVASGMISLVLLFALRFTLSSEDIDQAQLAPGILWSAVIFSGMGLQFFKKDKKVTHVSVAKPNFLDVEVEPVSDGIRKVIQFIEVTPNCTRRHILENLGGLAHVEPKEGENPPPMAEQTEEQKQLISDIHWLIHQHRFGR